MGCPFVEEEVGFFNIKQNWKRIDKLLLCFSSIASQMNKETLDVEYLEKYYQYIYYEYLDINNNLNEFFLKFLKNSYMSSASSYHGILNQNDLVYLNRDRTVIIGFSMSGLIKITEKIKGRFYKISSFFSGVDYSFAESGKAKITVDSKLLNEVKFIFEQLGSQDINEFYINSEYLLFNDIEQQAWFILTGTYKDQEKFFLKEQSRILDLYNKIDSHLPSDIKVSDYNYEKLTSAEFENMCQELLGEMGFVNVRQRGKTNASDGGIDIEADAQIKSPFGDELQHWIFQCKHTKKQLSRKDISEIPLLIEEFNAEGYGIFYSGHFSPQTIERIKNLKCRTQYLGRRDLNIELRKNTRIILKYFGSDS